MNTMKFFMLILSMASMKALLSRPQNSYKLNHPLKERILSHKDELEEDYSNQRGVNQMKMMMSNMKRDNGIKNIEMALNEIGDQVEEINESMMAKLAEFTDAIERVKSQKTVDRKMYRLPPKHL